MCRAKVAARSCIYHNRFEGKCNCGCLLALAWWTTSIHFTVQGFSSLGLSYKLSFNYTTSAFIFSGQNLYMFCVINDGEQWPGYHGIKWILVWNCWFPKAADPYKETLVYLEIDASMTKCVTHKSLAAPLCRFLFTRKSFFVLNSRCIVKCLSAKELVNVKYPAKGRVCLCSLANYL